ncbi:MAG: hypothetical protein KC478_10740 [Bacteriovoracaceae bacterium]|nr:hypothetical protein [Bacteriovoracaceae bacterium]
MYVKKFEAETLDEALRSVKSELGPDAIILKTITNKGLKGAFKKGRVEITAAISEDSYTKKSNVDRALGEHKENFYQAPSSSINHMINEYNEHTPAPTPKNSNGYGNMGLNKVVNTVSKASHKFKSSLDDFLTTEEDSPGTQSMDDFMSEEEEAPVRQTVSRRETVQVEQEQSYEPQEVATRQESGPNEYERRLKAQLDSQKKQIEILEQKLFELSKNSFISKAGGEDENPSIIELRESLKTLDLNDSIVGRILKKARFELTESEQKDEDLLFDLALRELASMINTGMPLFSSTQEDNTPVVTALISEASCGQTSMAMKLAVLMEDVKIIRLRDSKSPIDNEFAQKVFKLDISNVETLSHLMSEARKAMEANKQVLLDIKVNSGKEDESKKILDTLQRSFKKLEILANISAIHSELYNRKILSKYKEKLNGVIISNVDQCLNYGALVNTHYKYNTLPLKFFGTGPTVPDDIEGATAERILAGMFNL